MPVRRRYKMQPKKSNSYKAVQQPNQAAQSPPPSCQPIQQQNQANQSPLTPIQAAQLPNQSDQSDQSTPIPIYSSQSPSYQNTDDFRMSPTSDMHIHKRSIVNDIFCGIYKVYKVSDI